MHLSRSGRVAGAVAAMLTPALIAGFLSAPQAPKNTPRVTRVLQELDRKGPDRSQRLDDSPVAPATRNGREISIKFKRGRRSALGRMEIPSIDVRTKFYEGVVDEAVKLGPGHWPGTPFPGKRGNSVFAGHRTTYTHPFEDLDLLNQGARVRVGMRNGKTTTYRVFRTRIASESEYAKVVLKQPRKLTVRMITLFACTPKGSRSHRIIVQARAMPTGAKPSAKRGGKAMKTSS